MKIQVHSFHLSPMLPVTARQGRLTIAEAHPRDLFPDSDSDSDCEDETEQQKDRIMKKLSILQTHDQMVYEQWQLWYQQFVHVTNQNHTLTATVDQLRQENSLLTDVLEDIETYHDSLITQIMYMTDMEAKEAIVSIRKLITEVHGPLSSPK